MTARNELARLGATGIDGTEGPVDGEYEEPAAAPRARLPIEDAEAFRDFRYCRLRAIEALKEAAQWFSGEHNAAFAYPHKFEISRGSFCQSATMLRLMTEALIEIARKPA